MSYTKGPWAFEEDDFMVYSAEDMPVAAVNEAFDFPCLDESKTDEVQAECLSNARLIAAAPELLEAVKRFVAACYEQNVKLGAIVGDAEAAIAKATGRQP